jgi:hypothetical protein
VLVFQGTVEGDRILSLPFSPLVVCTLLWGEVAGSEASGGCGVGEACARLFPPAGKEQGVIYAALDYPLPGASTAGLQRTGAALAACFATLRLLEGTCCDY